MSARVIPDDAAGRTLAIVALRRGDLVALPTDTVYGIGVALGTSGGIERLFAAKRRPPEQSLPVAVKGIQMADELAVVTYDSRRLMEAFWPGALTIVLEKKAMVPDVTTGGRREVAVRTPNHQVPLQIIGYSGLPLITTSANIHGKPSSLTAEEAKKQLGGEVDLILDGGNATDRPSTILDMVSVPPRILRLGSVTKEEIMCVLDYVVL